MSDAETTPAAEPVRFRPSKKRKVLRKRASSDSGAEDDAPSSAPAPAPASRAVASDYFPPTNDDDNDDDGTNDSTPAAVAARARRRARLKGMAFRAGPSSSSTVAAERPSSSAAEQAIALGIDDRFTRQTGLISDVNDRHMNEFIESRLRRQATDDGQHEAQNPLSTTRSLQPQPSIMSAQPLVQGKLMEVDVPGSGPRAGAGAEVDELSRPQHAQPQQQRAPEDAGGGRRKRRTSEDMKRDKMVEEFLHENRLDVYDVPEPEAPVTGDGEADEQLARQFRQQFQEEMARRRERKRLAMQSTRKKPGQQAASGAGGQAGKAPEVLRGPKLGGSRNSRAAVRNALLEQEKAKSKR